jgi:hypothetical protein
MSYFKRLVGGGLQHVRHVALSAVPARSVTIPRCGMLCVTLRCSSKRTARVLWPANLHEIVVYHEAKPVGFLIERRVLPYAAAP